MSLADQVVAPCRSFPAGDIPVAPTWGAPTPGFKRHIVYLGGFDPRGLRHTRSLLGAALDQSRRVHRPHDPATPADASWTVADPAGSDLAPPVRLDWLGWDDLVRSQWPRHPARVLAQLALAYARFGWRGEWHRARRVAWGPRLALLLPALVVLALAAALLGGSAAVVLGWQAGHAGMVLAGVAVAALALPARRWWRRSHCAWVARVLITADRYAAAGPSPVLAARLDAWAARIAADLATTDAHEVMVIGHSFGAVLAADLAARIVERRGPGVPARLVLVTLGGTIPLVAFRRDAQGLRHALATLAAVPLVWLDLASPADAAAIAGVAPWLDLVAAPVARLTSVSPRWYRFAGGDDHTTDPLQRHFTYLRRLARPSPLDVVGLMTAPQPLVATIAAFRAL